MRSVRTEAEQRFHSHSERPLTLTYQGPSSLNLSNCAFRKSPFQILLSAQKRNTCSPVCKESLIRFTDQTDSSGPWSQLRKASGASGTHYEAPSDTCEKVSLCLCGDDEFDHSFGQM